MEDPYSWKQEGVISLWRYTEFPKKYGGWHLTANSAGVSSLLSLLKLLAGSPHLYRTVTVTPPSPLALRAPNFQQGRAAWVAPAKWQIRCALSERWQFPANLEPATLTVGGEFLQALESGLKGIPKGEGDFGIGNSDPLYFWWWLGAGLTSRSRRTAAPPLNSSVSAQGEHLDSEARATIGTISRQLFYELAMHHHNYIMARRFKDEALPGQEPEYQAHYFRLVVSHNYAMLALTLCKVMEFHTAFRSALSGDLKNELDQINSRLARSRILDYRNKYVGHLFDKTTRQPLHPTAILGYWEALLEGQSEEQFRAWWWSTRQEPELRSVAGLMARIADNLHER